VYEAGVRSSLPVLVLVGATVVARPAFAENDRLETAAKKALKAAEADYLGMRYTAGVARLRKAAAACGEKGCSPLTRAALVCDVATMLYRSKDQSAAEKAWKIAVKISPDIMLNPAYEQPDVAAAFIAATIGPPPGRGDFAHTAPAEQKANTPLPLYFTGGGGDVEHLVVHYLPQGGASWKTVELAKQDKGWGGVVPCVDVTVGYFRYYVQGQNGHRASSGSTGDAQHVFVVPIRDQISSDAPHLPGKAPPRSCSDTGQESAEGSHPAAASGSEKTEQAKAPDKSEGSGEEKAPEKGEDKGEGGEAPSAHGPAKRIWIGATFGLEVMVMPSGTDLCIINPSVSGPGSAQPGDPNHLYCTADNGADFPPRTPAGYTQNMEIIPGQGGTSNGGVALANTRLLVSADYAITDNILIGARAGIVFNTYPGQAAVNDGRTSSLGPLHLEVRGTYLFGDEPLAKLGIAPMAFGGAGISQFDASVGSTVSLTTGETGAVNIWKTNGPGFVTAGGGIRWALTDRIAATAALRVNLAFGNDFSWTFGPEIGAAYGF
jgi:hypothetical protein